MLTEIKHLSISELEAGLDSVWVSCSLTLDK
jgi:hypothetical protein